MLVQPKHGKGEKSLSTERMKAVIVMLDEKTQLGHHEGKVVQRQRHAVDPLQ